MTDAANPFDALLDQPAADGSSGFDGLVDQLAEQKKREDRQRFLETQQNAQTIDPARQAKAIGVAKEQGVPVGVAYDNLDQYNAQKQVPDFDALLSKAPVTAKLVSDPVAGPVATPDHKELSDIEQNLAAFSYLRGLDKPKPTQPLLDQLFGTGSMYLTPEQQAAEQASRVKAATENVKAQTEAERQAQIIADNERKWREQVDPNFVNGGANYNPASDLTKVTAAGQVADAKDALKLAQTTPPNQKAAAAYANTVIRTLAGFGISSAQGLSALADSLQYYAPLTKVELDKNGRSGATQFFADLNDYVSQLFPEDKGRAQDLGQRGTGAVASSLPFLAGGVGVKALGQSPEWFAGIFGALQQAGQGEADAVANGASINTKNLTTWLNLALGATEAVPIEALFATASAGTKGLAQFLAATASNASIEAAQNVVQQVPADLWAKWVYDPKRDVLGNAMEALKMGGLAGSLFGAGAHLVSSAAEDNHQKLLAIGEAAGKARISEIAPEILDEHIAQLKRAGAAPEHVTAPAEAVETLFQGLDPEGLQKFPETVRSLAEAKATGAEVTIPTEELVRLGKLQGYQNFAADVRVGDDMTLNEASKLREEIGNFVKEQDTSSSPSSQDESPIFKDLRDQLVRAGNTPEVATAQARLMDAFFSAQSERTGVPAQDLARRYGVEITNTAVEAAGQTTLSQDAFNSWFGGSKVVDEQGAPLVVYHGTNDNIEQFRHDMPNKRDTGWLGRGFYFITDPKTASDYTSLKPGNDANVMPVYLSLKNPYQATIKDKERIMLAEKRGEKWAASEWADELKRQGYDGVVLDYGQGLKGYNVKEYVAFDPEQIKSVHNRGAFDPSNPNILYQAAEPTVEGQSPNAGNKHGFAPYLRVETGIEIPKGKKPLFAQTTMNSTAKRQIAAIDEVLGRHPDATASIENWNAMMADALASSDVPLPPYAFIKNLNGDGSRELLAKLSPGQIADADHGFANAALFRQSYTSGRISIESTGKLFLWSFLSRGVSPYTQESLFIDSFAGIDQWIKAAADGTLKDRLGEYEAWAKTAAPQGSGQPGAGATHNLNAFGKLFLLKMSEDAGDGTGRSRLQVLHDMMSDPNSTGRDVRRKFLEMGEGVGIDNKVVSFTLLVAGFTDVMVLDRVQIRELWNDGRFDGINLYDGYKVDGKPVAGSALSNLTYGARGLLIYEAIEQGLKAKINELYAQLGRPEAASVGRYHWETWVASSEQEASHATIDAILVDAHGAQAPLQGVTAKEGEYGAFAYGARYGRDGEGKPYFLYSVPGLGDYRFTVDQFRDFLEQIKVKGNGVIPGKFKVTESGNGPWYNRPEVSLPKLAELAGRIGERYEAGRLSDADAAHGIDPPVSNRLAADQPGAPPQGAGQQAVTEAPSGASSASGTTLNQGGKDVRGSISFGPLRDKFRITLTEKANLSTFLHEGGHFFLEVLQDLVARGEASAQQVADLKTLKRWMGLEDAKPVDVAGHEKFARTFEQFLMEGKAPSLALHGIFQKFKAWMIFVYKRLANVRGELNDEVRAVMDRLVASDAAIAEARAMVGWRGSPMSQEETGLTDAEYKAYVGEWTKANDAQSADADARIMLEAARELKKTWAEEKTKITKEAEKALAETRGWKAWKLLEKGEGIEEFGRSSIKIDPDTLPREWRRDTAGMTAPADQGGLDFDMVAELLGFETGEEMLQAIGGAKLAQKAIPAKVRQIMMERHGEMDAAQLSQEAMKAVHNTPTMDVLLTEFRALAAKANLKVGKDTKRLIRATAEERVAQIQVRKLEPAKWRRAEVKAAEEAGKLAAKGRDMEAALAKRRQLMAAAMAKASLEAQDRASAIKDYLDTFTTNRRRAALGKAGDAYLDQVDGILEAVQLKEVSLKAIKARQGLDEFVKEQEAAGEPVFISSQTRDLLGRKNYTEMTLEELEGIHDAVKNLWTVAKEINTVRRESEKIALENALAEITKETEETLPVKKQRDHLNPGRIDKMMAGIGRYHAGNLKIEFVLDWLGETAHSLIFQPIANAAHESWKLHRDLTAPFMDKLRNMPKEQKQRWNTKRQFLNYPLPLKGANIWMIALNMGNAGNKEKMLAGYGWTESQVMAELATFMTKEDWDLAQEALDTIEKMWPKMEAVVKRATGLSPPKVEATPIETPFGTYRGGYFPVVYDTAIDARTDDKLDSSISPEEMFSKRFTAFVINNGFTKGRTANVGKLLFSPDVIADHLGEVIHYATHYDAVKQADKIIRAPAFKALVKDHLGTAVYAEMKQWLKDVATNTTRSDRQAKAGDWALRWARNSAQLASLGLNIKSALKQPLGIMTTLDALGSKHWAIGIQKAWLSPNAVQNWKDAFAKSKELGPLVRGYDRDLAAISRAYADSLGNRAHQGLYQLAFAPISVMQSVANVAAWHGAYSQATEQGMSDQEAIDFADKIVRTTQGSGALKDLSGMQRGGEANKFFTMFYSYFGVLYNRLADVEIRNGGVKNLHKRIGRYTVLLLLPELLNTLFDDGWNAMFPPDKKKDEEDGGPWSFLTRLALNTVDSTVNTMPVVRDAYTAVAAIASGTQVRTPPALGGVAKAIAGGKAVVDLLEGKDMTRAKGRNLAALVSIVTSTPVYGAYRILDDLFGSKIFDE